jgi:hypothetical protein
MLFLPFVETTRGSGQEQAKISDQLIDGIRSVKVSRKKVNRWYGTLGIQLSPGLTSRKKPVY